MLFGYSTLLQKPSFFTHLFWRRYCQLAAQYSLHPTVINNWKRQLLESATQVFETENSANRASSDTQSQIDELYRQIGQLKVERDFLANRSAKLGLPTEKLW